jgi:hypothetical protein
VEFGDDEPEDAFDPTGVLDPEQVARRLHELRVADGLDRAMWDELSKPMRARIVLVIVALLAWMRQEGAIQ